MNPDEEAKKVIWSLQNNKRTEEERNVFKPTGKKPMNKNLVYLLSAIGIAVVMSFVLTQFSRKNTTFCFLVNSYCFESKEENLLYSVYIFLNIWILLMAFFGAYYIGKKLGNKYRI